MPAQIGEIISEIDRLLEPERFEDYCFNGLQVPGATTIETLVTGVSAHADLFAKAAVQQADLVLVHHGLFWGKGVDRIDDTLHGRLKTLFDSDMALAAYHLPLDAHPELGNNALLAKALGAGDPTPFALHDDQPTGVLAELADGPIAIGELLERVREATGRAPLLLDGGPPQVHRIAVATGKGADYLTDAHAAQAHVLVTGEAEERTMALARELGVHVIAAGHHATETFGVRALGERLAARFDLRHVFLEASNPV